MLATQINARNGQEINVFYEADFGSSYEVVASLNEVGEVVMAKTKREVNFDPNIAQRILSEGQVLILDLRDDMLYVVYAEDLD